MIGMLGWLVDGFACVDPLVVDVDGLRQVVDWALELLAADPTGDPARVPLHV